MASIAGAWWQKQGNMCFRWCLKPPGVACCWSFWSCSSNAQNAGMPFPQNFETAKEVEAIVRQSGASPATIAILDGVPCIGTNSPSSGSYVWWPLLVFMGWPSTYIATSSNGGFAGFYRLLHSVLHLSVNNFAVDYYNCRSHREGVGRACSTWIKGAEDSS